MKRFIAVCLVCLFCTFGCAALKADFAKVEIAVESINWSEVETYWSDFVKGLNEALPVVSAIFPSDPKTIALVGSVVGDANNAVNDIETTVAAVQAGTLTEAQAVTTTQNIVSNITTASNAVGAALKGDAAGVVKAVTKPAPASAPATSTSTPAAAPVAAK